jgi:hypothetical protein
MGEESVTGLSGLSWWIKFAIAVAVDLFDMTVGRFLFVVPYSGEIIGTAVAVALFGWKGLFYLAEVIDPSEQIDGFIPTCTLIALAARRDLQR